MPPCRPRCASPTRSSALPSRVSRFVLTVGATANQNGTALFEGVTVLFLAQFFGVELSLAQQVTVMFVCILGGIGTAGVPAGSLPVVALICAMVGVPAGRHRPDPRRRPLPRHVPHHAQRHRRPDAGDGGVAGRDRAARRRHARNQLKPAHAGTARPKRPARRRCGRIGAPAASLTRRRGHPQARQRRARMGQYAARASAGAA